MRIRASMASLLPTYRCPHCQARLRSGTVWWCGAWSPATCSGCQGRYFGGGVAEALWLLCGGAYAWVLTWSLNDASHWAHAWLALAVGAGAISLWRAQPLPASAARRQTVKMFLAPASLWLAMEGTAKAAGWLAMTLTG